MKEKDAYAELSSIRNLMERSSKFISLSGMSGVMAGIFALTGAFLAYRIVYQTNGGLQYRNYYINDFSVLFELIAIAVVVLLMSIATGVLLTIREANKKGEDFWNPVSRRLLTNFAIPLVAGGLFISILIYQGAFGIVASASLIFYGLALISASQYTFSDVKWLGLCEITLGLLAAAFPGYGIVFWSVGFGFLHIIYGTVMHFKYNR